MYSFAPVQRVLAILLLLFAQFMWAPVLVSWIYQDGKASAFLWSYAITVGLGAALWLPVRQHARELRNRDGFLIVSLAWLTLALVSTLPLLLGGTTGSLSDALFETTSGLTTTGSTVFSGLDQMPPSINFWRLLLNFVGGMGIIVLAVAILPMLGVGGRQIFKAETPGPMKDAALTPRITSTAKLLWLVYVGLTLLCAIALWLAGMSPFDAITHSFSAISAGGFSTHDASVGYFDSPLIELILILGMLAAGINFATHFLALRARNLGPYLRDREVLAYLSVLLLCCLLGAFYLWWYGTYPAFLSALRYVSFNLISMATSTGLVNTDYSLWPAFVPVMILMLTCFVSCAGSTGGGIKMARALLLYKQGLRELHRLIHPHGVDPVKLGGKCIDEAVITAVWGFFFLYIASITLITLALCAVGMDFTSAFTATIASINNAGPGLGEVGPASNYGAVPLLAKWILTFTMLLGRLEIYTILVLFTRSFWRY